MLHNASMPHSSSDMGSPTKSATARPFLKWVGGKSSLLPLLLERVPDRIDEYYEPFLGGGSLFFALASRGRLRHAHLSDVNKDLVVTYNAVRDDVDAVIQALRTHAELSCEEHYYEARDLFNSGALDPIGTAATMIYLNRVGFNGVWRVNSSGELNVPWGRRDDFCPDEDGLRASSKALAQADISHRQFDSTPVGADGFYYFDPPYDATYEKYTKGGFGRDCHERLADYTEKLDVVGAKWLLSNSGTDFVRSLWAGRKIEDVEVCRRVGGSGASRGKAKEILVSSEWLGVSS